MFLFPKNARLLKSYEYRKVCLAGTSHVGKYIIIQILPIEKKEESSTQSKLGISVPRQYGKAHIRNTFKRRIREIFRQSSDIRQCPLLLHIKPRSSARTATFQQIAGEFHSLLYKFSG